MALQVFRRQVLDEFVAREIQRGAHNAAEGGALETHAAQRHAARIKGDDAARVERFAVAVFAQTVNGGMDDFPAVALHDNAGNRYGLAQFELPLPVGNALKPDALQRAGAVIDARPSATGVHGDCAWE